MDYAKIKSIATNPKDQIDNFLDKKIIKIKKVLKKEKSRGRINTVLIVFDIFVWLDQNSNCEKVLPELLCERFKFEFCNGGEFTHQ